LADLRETAASEKHRPEKKRVQEKSEDIPISNVAREGIKFTGRSKGKKALRETKEKKKSIDIGQK